MPYDFQLPTEPDEWTRVTLFENGDIVFRDYDLEHEVAAAVLGLEPTLAVRVYKMWEKDPTSILCGKHELLPLRDSALAAWAWARLAVDVAGLNINWTIADRSIWPVIVPIQEMLENALKVSFSALTKKRVPFKKLVVARRDVANRIVEVGEFHRTTLVSKQKRHAMHAVKHLLDGIIGTVQDEAFSGLPSQNATAFCEVERETSEVLREDFDPYDPYPETEPYEVRIRIDDELIENAIKVMGEVQEAEGGLK